MADKQPGHEVQKQMGKQILPMLSEPNFIQNLIQNKSLLSQLADADPDVVNQIISLLESLLDENTNLSNGLQADVDQALIYKNANASALTSAQDDKKDADEALDAAIIVVNDRQDDYDAAVIVHDTKVQEQSDQQPILTTEAGIINNAIELLNGLLPGGVESVTYMGVGQCWDDWWKNVPSYLYDQLIGCMWGRWDDCPWLSHDQCKEKALGLPNAIGFGLVTNTPMTYDQGEDLASGQCRIYFSKFTPDCEGLNHAQNSIPFRDSTVVDYWQCNSGGKWAETITGVTDSGGRDNYYANCWKIGA